MYCVKARVAFVESEIMQIMKRGNASVTSNDKLLLRGRRGLNPFVSSCRKMEAGRVFCSHFSCFWPTKDSFVSSPREKRGRRKRRKLPFIVRICTFVFLLYNIPKIAANRFRMRRLSGQNKLCFLANK